MAEVIDLVDDDGDEPTIEASPQPYSMSMPPSQQTGQHPDLARGHASGYAVRGQPAAAGYVMASDGSVHYPQTPHPHQMGYYTTNSAGQEVWVNSPSPSAHYAAHGGGHPAHQQYSHHPHHDRGGGYGGHPQYGHHPHAYPPSRAVSQPYHSPGYPHPHGRQHHPQYSHYAQQSPHEGSMYGHPAHGYGANGYPHGSYAQEASDYYSGQGRGQSHPRQSPMHVNGSPNGSPNDPRPTSGSPVVSHS